MADEDTQTPEPASLAEAVAALSPEAKDHWQLTGELPETPDPGETPDPSTPEPESSPAPPAEQAVSTETREPAASEPATPKPGEKNVKTRHAELDADIAELKTKLDFRRRLRDELASLPESTPAPASSATAPASLSTFIASPDLTTPVVSDGKFFEQFPDATMGDYARYAARYEFLTLEAHRAQQQELSGRVSKFQQATTKAIEADPAFWSKVHPRVVELRTVDGLGPQETPNSLNYAAQEILQADHPDRIMLHLSEHLDELDRMSRMSASDAVRAIVRLDTKLAPASVSSQPVVPPKTTTSAPAPPQTLGTKPATGGDDLAEAVKTGDVRRYMAIMNRRESSEA